MDEEDELVLHGYTNSNAGYEDVRQAVAESLNERFGTAFAKKKYYDDSWRKEAD